MESSKHPAMKSSLPISLAMESPLPISPSMKVPKHSSLIPQFLYSARSFPNHHKSLSPPLMRSSFLIASPPEFMKGIEIYSPSFYMTCLAAGYFSCGVTHIPSDFGGFDFMKRARGFFRAEGACACKFGVYEFFKKNLHDITGPDYYVKHRTLINLAAAATSEIATNITMCPFKLGNVPSSTTLYNGIGPFRRRIPYTMIKLGSFDTNVEMIYKYAMKKPKDQCSKAQQISVSFAGVSIAGVICAIVFQPVDSILSYRKLFKGATIDDAVCNIGVSARVFTRGLLLRIIMTAALTGSQWGIYDALIKVYVGFPTTGGVIPAAAFTDEVEGLADDPMRNEVSLVREKIDSINKELKPLGVTVQEKEREYKEALEVFNEKSKEKVQLMEFVGESDQMMSMEELSKNINSIH